MTVRADARAAVLGAIEDLRPTTAAAILRGVMDGLPAAGSDRPGPNDRLPCGTDSARREHLAHGQTCPVCGVGDE